MQRIQVLPTVWALSPNSSAGGAPPEACHWEVGFESMKRMRTAENMSQGSPGGKVTQSISRGISCAAWCSSSSKHEDTKTRSTPSRFKREAPRNFRAFVTSG